MLSEIQPVWMFVAGCALLSWILLRRSYRYFGRRRNRCESPPLEKLHRPTGAWDGVQRDTSAQIERQKVEFYDMARDISGQLNSRIIVLEQLIATSARQIEQMEKLLDKLPSAQPDTPSAAAVAPIDYSTSSTTAQQLGSSS